MLHDVISRGSGTATTDIAAVDIWCEDKELASRVHDLIQPALSRVTLTVIEEWNPEDREKVPNLFILDDKQKVEAVENWLRLHPGETTSLLYIETNDELSRTGMQGFSRVQRLEKRYLNTCDTLVRGMLYPALGKQLHAVERSLEEKRELMEYVKEHLSIFYHNINNPLTVLSGNLQLLKILSESATLPSDISKSINDITEISGRFESDLKLVNVLRDKIHENS
ncbi:MAG: hypothetical protein KTR29_11975 [Rhodothermaceae bacterium]|nr:hypothetical protein [Rhodothermaceae bacterium]